MDKSATDVMHVWYLHYTISCKNEVKKQWQKVAKNGKIQNSKNKNPYIVFVIVEREKLVMYVGA